MITWGSAGELMSLPLKLTYPLSGLLPGDYFSSSSANAIWIWFYSEADASPTDNILPAVCRQIWIYWNLDSPLWKCFKPAGSAQIIICQLHTIHLWVQIISLKFTDRRVLIINYYFALKMGRIGFPWFIWQHTHCHDPMGSLCRSIFFPSCPYTARRSTSSTLLCDLLVDQFLWFLVIKIKDEKKYLYLHLSAPQKMDES